MAGFNAPRDTIGEGLVSWSYFAIVWLILWYLYRKGTLVRI